METPFLIVAGYSNLAITSIDTLYKMVEQRQKIFLVEDSEIYSLMLDFKLQDFENYQVTVFESAEEALANLYLNPDCIILDYQLPGMNGLEALRIMKNQKPNIPVIILSSQDDIQIAVETLKAGATEYITKSKLVMEDLCETIRSLCSK